VVELAKKAGPAGKRTIGILTKADTIEDGTYSQWLPVLEGTKYPLSLGYYCVVNPSQAAINAGVSMEEAAVEEAEFFCSNAFFASPQLAMLGMQGRFGVGAVKDALSAALVGMVLQELPHIRETAQAKLAQVESELMHTFRASSIQGV
jgi:hypothetical protein